MDRNPSTLTSDDTLGVNTMSSTIPITVRSSMFSNSFAEPTTEDMASGRTLSQGRISTLSSVVRPMPTTATRTIAITREESRRDALETVRQLIGSMSHTTILPVPTTTTAPHETRSDGDDINASNNEVRPRLSSSHLDSRMTDVTTPIGWLHPISISSGLVILTYREPVYFLGMMIQLLWLLEDWILKKDGKYITLMIFWELEDLLWIPLIIYEDLQKVKPWWNPYKPWNI